MKKNQRNQSQNVAVKVDYVVLGIVIGYLLVDFMSNFGRGDHSTPQFLYLNVLNVVVAACIAYFPQLRTGFDVTILRRQYIVVAYMAFVLLGGLTVATAVNQSLALVSLSRIVVVFTMFLNLTILLYDRFHLIYRICLVVGIAALLQAMNALTKIDFFAEWSVVDRAIAEHMKGNTGNINIFSASLLYKIPFILIGMWHYGEGWRRGLLSLSLFVTTSGVLLINARASLLALIAILLVFFVFYIRINRGSKVGIRRAGAIALPLIISLLAVGYARKDATGGRFGRSVVERVQDIQLGDGGARARFLYWENALRIARQNPVVGVGLGNWRVESIPYEPPLRNNVSLNTHNDYLEVTAETGFLNGLIYLSIFLWLGFVSLRRLLKNRQDGSRTIALLTLLLLIVYGNDALFNFPLYRPTMQVAFALLLAISLLKIPGQGKEEKTAPDSRDGKHPEKKRSPQGRLVPVIAVMALLPLYVSYQSDQTMLLETKIRKDPVTTSITANPAMKASEIVGHRPKLPNVLMSTTGSFAEYAGVLYYKEKDFEKATRYFDLANEINPYLGKADYYKYMIALAEKKPDSAYHYIKNSFYRRARDFEIYVMLLNMAVIHRDSSEIVHAYRHFNGIHHNPSALTESASSLIRLDRDYRGVVDFVEEEKAAFSASANAGHDLDSVFGALYNRIGKQLFSKSKRKEALELYQKGLESDPENPNLALNLGLYYVGEKDYAPAIDWLTKATTYPGLLRDNGEAEFALGLCHVVKNNRPLGCKFLLIAGEKKYARAAASIKSYCGGRD